MSASETCCRSMSGRSRMAFKPGSPASRHQAGARSGEGRGPLLVLGMHGGVAENGELQAMCELRGIPFTGSGSASSYLAFDKVGGQALCGDRRA